MPPCASWRLRLPSSWPASRSWTQVFPSQKQKHGSQNFRCCRNLPGKNWSFTWPLVEWSGGQTHGQGDATNTKTRGASRKPVVSPIATHMLGGGNMKLRMKKLGTATSPRTPASTCLELEGKGKGKALTKGKPALTKGKGQRQRREAQPLLALEDGNPNDEDDDNDDGKTEDQEWSTCLAKARKARDLLLSSQANLQEDMTKATSCQRLSKGTKKDADTLSTAQQSPSNGEEVRRRLSQGEGSS